MTDSSHLCTSAPVLHVYLYNVGMVRKRKWSNVDLTKAVRNSSSIRSVIIKLGLIPAGGNYKHVARLVKNLELDTSHFTGRAWRRGQTYPGGFRLSLEDILVKNSLFQSYKLKKRLFYRGLKSPKCEECGWAQRASDGRIPVELDHINGDPMDNRLENLRILCPNCHSLKPTHRGKNKRMPGWRNGRRSALKTL